MNIPSIHPFPARMAPEIAFEAIKQLRPQSVVLDPMMGSGTSLRTALEHGYNCCGSDGDPLAILISRAWNSVVDKEVVIRKSKNLFEECKQLGKTESD